MMPSEILKGLSVTFRSMFRKRTTTQYPEVKKPPSPRFHGRHQLNRYPDGLERCIGCELCAYACPADAIYVQGADNTPEARYSVGERYAAIYQINYNRCIFCGLCIEACPTRSLTMSNEYELARDNRQDLIFTKKELLAPLLPGMEQPPHPMRLGDSEKDYYVGALDNPGTSAGAETSPMGPGRYQVEAAIEETAVDLGAQTHALGFYEKLGFTVVPGGKHPVGSHNMLISFSDGSYLELIGFYRDATDHRWWQPLHPD